MPNYLLGKRDGENFDAFPTQQLHIIAGSSGAGKTTLLFQLVAAMKRGQQFFGYPTANVPVAYVPYDRNYDETMATMQRVGISENEMFVMPRRIPGLEHDARRDDRFMEEMQVVRQATAGAKLLIIDGFYALVPFGKMNDYLIMATFLQRVRDYAADNDMTIIGVAHSPKQREGNRIIDPRQLIQGSVAGGGFSSSGMAVMREKPTGECQNRQVYILPRNAPEHLFNVGMTRDGVLAESAYVMGGGDDGGGRSKALTAFMDMLSFMGSNGEELHTTEIIQGAIRHGLSQGSVPRWLNELVANGYINKVGRGVYVLSGPEAQPVALAGE
jgi:energy-coupling factor transporter ATP-binding protein EcfA2